MKSPKAKQKVKVNPTNMPGIESGNVMRRKVPMLFTPRSLEPSIRLFGIFSSVAKIGITMKGVKMYAMVIVMAY